jgi:hypothetical protein
MGSNDEKIKGGSLTVIFKKNADGTIEFDFKGHGGKRDEAPTADQPFAVTPEQYNVNGSVTGSGNLRDSLAGLMEDHPTAKFTFLTKGVSPEELLKFKDLIKDRPIEDYNGSEMQKSDNIQTIKMAVERAIESGGTIDKKEFKKILEDASALGVNLTYDNKKGKENDSISINGEKVEGVAFKNDKVDKEEYKGAGPRYRGNSDGPAR